MPESATDLKTAIDCLKQKVRAAKASPAGRQIARFCVEVDNCDPLLWLGRQTGLADMHRVYWRSRDRLLEGASIGAVEVIRNTESQVVTSYIRDLLRNGLSETSDSDTPLRLYGGWRFASKVTDSLDDTWTGFGPSCFVLPLVELSRESGRARLSCNMLVDGSAPTESLHATADALDRVTPDVRPPEQPLPRIIGRQDNPDRAGWASSIAAATVLLDSGTLEKIVLARKSSFKFETRIDPFDLLYRLRHSFSEQDIFWFQPHHSAAFLGATPERLFRRVGRDLLSEALAGTRPRGETQIEDNRLGKELLESNKDRREHEFVVRNLREKLSALSESLDQDAEVSLRRLPNVQHLLTEFRVHLKPDVDDFDLLQALHPTPAVGGHPCDIALEHIPRLEEFDRGWYAGPIGWMTADSAEFAVGIRSGVVSGSCLTLYSGAGIVEGSKPEDEWQEIEAKMKGFLRAIGN